MKSFLTILPLCLAIWGVEAAPPTASLERRAVARLFKQCTKPNTVALTFNDGPHTYSGDIVDALNAAGAKGTFFVNGKNFACIYSEDSVKRLQYAYDHGHQLASHTWAHKDLTTLSREQIDYEMSRVEQALEKIIGAYPAFTRPPYGSYNNLVLDVSGSRGQSVVTWDLDSQDSLGVCVGTSKELYDFAINQRPISILAFNQETIKTTAHQLVPRVIQRLQAAGYKLVTVAECLGMPAYQSITTPRVRDASWKC